MTTQSVSIALKNTLFLATVALLVGCTGSHLGSGNNDAPGPDATVDPDAGQCGQGDDEKLPSGKPKIYHGTLTPEICMSPRQQHAVGALLLQEYNWSNGCTGTLINENTVITAAHCVTHWNGGTINPGSVRFAIGADASNPDYVINVTAVYGNPAYQGDADHDNGILKLAQPITAVGSDALPIPVNQSDLGSSFVGDNVQNGGYGSTEVTDENSRMYWTVEPVTEVHGGEIVVYGGGSPNGSSVCYGDSGGPSFHLFGGSALAILGTVSWGDPSCMDYDHFARLDDNITWIEQYAGTLDPCVNLTEQGLCDANVAIWCENGTLQQQCCGDTGDTCGQDGAGNYRCSGADECEGLDFQGECRGNDAYWCDNGQLKSRRCEPCDQICDWAGDALGYYCVDP